MGEFALLSHDETIKLICAAKMGDKEAKERLLEGNYPLIKSIASRFRNKGVEYDDLYQLGCVGFLKAIENFDTNFDVRFSTYAVPMIAGEIKRFLRDDGPVKVSRALKTLSAKVNRYLEEYRKKQEKDPTIAEIASELNVDETDVIMAMESSQALLPIDERDENHDKSLSIIEKMSIEDGGQDRLLSNFALKQAIEGLDEKEQKIVIQRYYFGRTQSEIAASLGVSQVQVSRIENKILDKLKQKLK